MQWWLDAPFDPFEWHDWFAWRPVRVEVATGSFRRVWLERIQRRKVLWIGNSGMLCIWDYKL